MMTGGDVKPAPPAMAMRKESIKGVCALGHWSRARSCGPKYVLGTISRPRVVLDIPAGRVTGETGAPKASACLSLARTDMPHIPTHHPMSRLRCGAGSQM